MSDFSGRCILPVEHIGHCSLTDSYYKKHTINCTCYWLNHSAVIYDPYCNVNRTHWYCNKVILSQPVSIQSPSQREYMKQKEERKQQELKRNTQKLERCVRYLKRNPNQ